jgi:hypothetical protein
MADPCSRLGRNRSEHTRKAARCVPLTLASGHSSDAIWSGCDHGCFPSREAMGVTVSRARYQSQLCVTKYRLYCAYRYVDTT